MNGAGTRALARSPGLTPPLGRIPSEYRINVPDKPELVEERGDDDRDEQSLGGRDPLLLGRLLEDGIQRLGAGREGMGHKKCRVK